MWTYIICWLSLLYIILCCVHLVQFLCILLRYILFCTPSTVLLCYYVFKLCCILSFSSILYWDLLCCYVFYFILLYYIRLSFHVLYFIMTSIRTCPIALSFHTCALWQCHPLLPAIDLCILRHTTPFTIYDTHTTWPLNP